MFGISIISNAQNTKDTSVAFKLVRNNELMIGVYGAPNYTFVIPSETGGLINAAVGIGYNTYLTAKLRLQQGLFFSGGIYYEMQKYKLSETGGSDTLPASSGAITYNNDHYTCSFTAYNIGIPLSFGYGIKRKKWSFYFALGVEFYYNFKNEESILDDTKGVLLEQATFYHSRELLKTQIIYSPFNMINYYQWNSLYAYGLVNIGISFKISPKVTIAFEPTLRFTNVFVPPVPITLFSNISGLAPLSLNLGLSYSFQFQDIGSFKPIEKDKKKRGFILGFHVIPTAYLVIPVSHSGYFKFCYTFSTQFSLSNRFAIETGIVEDNTYFSYALIGIPVIAKYYFSDKAEKNSFYIAAGCHIDYTAPIGFAYYPGRYLLPTALVEGGYEVAIGHKVVSDFALGYKNWLNTIVLSGGNSFNLFTLSQSSHSLYASIGFGYRFEK